MAFAFYSYKDSKIYFFKWQYRERNKKVRPKWKKGYLICRIDFCQKCFAFLHLYLCLCICVYFTKSQRRKKCLFCVVLCFVYPFADSRWLIWSGLWLPSGWMDGCSLGARIGWANGEHFVFRVICWCWYWCYGALLWPVLSFPFNHIKWQPTFIHRTTDSSLIGRCVNF